MRCFRVVTAGPCSQKAEGVQVEERADPTGEDGSDREEQKEGKASDHPPGKAVLEPFGLGGFNVMLLQKKSVSRFLPKSPLGSTPDAAILSILEENRQENGTNAKNTARTQKSM